MAQLASNFLAIADSIAEGQDTNVVFRLNALASWTQCSDDQAERAAEFLVTNGLAWYGQVDGALGIRVTRLGWSQIRKRFEEWPEIPTPGNVTHIMNSNVGAIQQGNIFSSQSTGGVTQLVLTPREDLALRGFLAQARDELDRLPLERAAQQEAETFLAELEAEAASERPEKGRIQQLLGALSDIAVGAAGSATWTSLQAVVEVLG